MVGVPGLLAYLPVVFHGWSLVVPVFPAGQLVAVECVSATRAMRWFQPFCQDQSVGFPS
jgi:hypothetical protein